jgi:hypothetical protein
MKKIQKVLILIMIQIQNQNQNLNQSLIQNFNLTLIQNLYQNQGHYQNLNLNPLVYLGKLMSLLGIRKR